MEKVEIVEELDDEKFRRLTGVKKVTFNKMVEILREGKKAKGGRKNKLSEENMLLMVLREYGTYFHKAME
ncbi:putative transposase [Wolbachia endosymbiont of Cylisticus convexus]|nr:putative transposase [Wolbachia endosymbiont of Cylisticus convexus]